MTDLQMKLTAAAICVFLIFTLYRKITDIAKIMLGLWIVMIGTTGWVIVTGLLNFNPALAFDLPPDAFRLDFDCDPRPGPGHRERPLPVPGLLPGLLPRRRGQEPREDDPPGGGAFDPRRHADRRGDLLRLHRRGAVAGGDAVRVPGRPVHGRGLRPVGGEPAGRPDRHHRLRVDLRAAPGLLPRALRRRPGRGLLQVAGRAAPDQGVPPPLAAPDRRAARSSRASSAWRK